MQLKAYAVILLTVSTCGLCSYVLYPGVGYYKVHNQTVTWSEAYTACLREGGHLPIVNSKREAQVVWEICKKHATSYNPYCHLGFHDLYLKDNFTTLNGQTLETTGYFEWGHSYCIAQNLCAHNTTDSGPRCGALAYYSIETGLFLRSCTRDILTFFCEKELWHDYELVPDTGYYKLHHNGATWGNAWKICRDEGADLAVIESRTEASTIQNILARYPELPSTDNSTRIHLGFHNKYDPTIFTTVDGLLLNSTTYLEWEFGEPTDRGNCGGLVRKGDLFMGSCDAKLAFFCKHRVN